MNMTPEVLKIVLSAIGGVVVGIIGVYREELKNILFGTRKFKYLVGEWDCIWHVNPSDTVKVAGTITDRVTISKVYGSVLKGNGSTGHLGKWDIKGKMSESAITIMYNPQRQDRKHNLGVVILQVEYSNKNELKGMWYQFNGLELVGGDTSWKKIN
jgi:hypothetical protein